MHTTVKLALVVSAFIILMGTCTFVMDSGESRAESTVVSDFEELKIALESNVPDIEIAEKIVISENVMINEYTRVHIASGGELFLPFDKNDTTGVALGESSKYPFTRISASDSEYCYLTLTNNGTIECDGKITVGSVLGASKTRSYQGHTSSYHSTIINNGVMKFENGSVFNCYGYLKGSGQLIAHSGSKILEPMIITDFVGGEALLNQYDAGQSIFNRYALINIQCQMTVFEGSKLSVLITPYIGKKFYQCELDFVGDTNALIKLNDGAELTITYDPNKSLENNETLNIHKDVGKSTLTFRNGAEFGSVEVFFDEIPIVGSITLSTRMIPFSIPYNFDIIFENGSYNLQNYYRLLPGSNMIIAKDASVTVSGTLEVFWELEDKVHKDVRYPTSSTLQSNGFDHSARLMVYGKLYLINGSHFKGIAEGIGDSALLVVSSHADTSTEQIKYGCNHKYNILVGRTNNLTTRFMAGMFVTCEGKLEQILAGNQYSMSGSITKVITPYIQNNIAITIESEFEGGWELIEKHYQPITIHHEGGKFTKDIVENAFQNADISSNAEVSITSKKDTLILNSEAVNYIVNTDSKLKIVSGIYTISIETNTLGSFEDDILICTTGTMNKAQEKSATDKQIHFISIYDGNKKLTMVGGVISVSISTELSGDNNEKLQIWHIDDNGQISSYMANYSDGTLSFETPVLNCFAISYEDIPTHKIKINISNYVLIGIVAIIAIISISIIAIVKYKTGKE